MNELVDIITDLINSDDGPWLFDEYQRLIAGDKAVELAKQIAEAIVAAGWPRS